VWVKFPNVGTVIPLLMWMEDYTASLISIRKILSKLEVICQNLKSWEFKAILQYVIDITNKLGESMGKKVTGFRINSLLSLVDMKSQRVKDLSLAHFLAEELTQKDEDILKAVKVAADMCGEALGSIVEVHVLFPNATLKYFEILNMLKKADPETEKEFIEQLHPFSEKLRSVLIDLNEKLRTIDRDISYFGGIHYEQPMWSANQSIMDITAAWQRLVSAGILLSEEVNMRTEADSTRYVFFAEMHKFLSEFLAAQLFNISKKKKEEQQNKVAEKKSSKRCRENCQR